MDQNFLLTSGSSAVIAAYVLQYLKQAQWFPWLSIEKAKERWNLVASVLTAALVSIGVHYTYNAQTGQLIVDGLTWAAIQHFVAHTAGQWVIQHISYKSLVVPSELLAAIVNQLKDMQKGS